MLSRPIEQGIPDSGLARHQQVRTGGTKAKQITAREFQDFSHGTPPIRSYPVDRGIRQTVQSQGFGTDFVNLASPLPGNGFSEPFVGQVQILSGWSYGRLMIEPHLPLTCREAIYADLVVDTLGPSHRIRSKGSMSRV